MFPDQFKNWSVHPHLKTSNHVADLGNYRPIAHLSFLPKLTEQYLNYACLLFIHQKFAQFFPVCPYSSHIIKAMSHQQITCLTLLDFSAACDTIDHYILLGRFSSSILHGLACLLLPYRPPVVPNDVIFGKKLDRINCSQCRLLAHPI